MKSYLIILVLLQLLTNFKAEASQENQWQEFDGNRTSLHPRMLKSMKIPGCGTGP